MDLGRTSHLQSQLLEKVSEQGGFAYAALIVLAAAGDLKAAEAAHEMAWEQLHAAPWHSVHPVWRDAYSLSCLQVASFLHGAGKSEEALRILDKGLIMGGPLLRTDLNSAISFFQTYACTVDRVSSSEDSEEPIVEDRLAIASDEGEGVRSEALNGIPTDFCGVPAPPKSSGLFSHGKVAAASINHEISGTLATPIESHPEDCSEVDPLSKACTLKVFAQLPRGSLDFTAVKKRALLAVEDFLCEFFIPGMPVIITNAMTHWPAMRKWRDLEYLKKTVGNRTVPVEVGEHYLASGWKQELMTISELLERLQSPECSPCVRAYLAQHPLFEQIPQLREDILIPDYCAASGGEIQSINAWLGPTGTVTPLHHDPHHNLLSQVVGWKYVRLYSPSVSDGMYPFSESMLSNSSQVDLDNPDYVKFPLAKSLPFLDCVLEEGEMLYIPPKWWHYVRSLSPSFSVSFWWSVEENS